MTEDRENEGPAVSSEQAGGAPADPGADALRPGLAGAPAFGGTVLYANAYVWYVLLASLDIMLTTVIMAADGHELNSVADRVIQRWGLPGLVVFKFAFVLLVIFICEIVGRRNDKTGRRLAEWSVAITAIPVVISIVQLLVLVYHIGPDQPIEPEDAEIAALSVTVMLGTSRRAPSVPRHNSPAH